MSKTLNSTIIDTPILNKRGSFEVPDPRKSCKKAYHAPPLLPLRCISRWCKECSLTKRVNWIIAHNYGEPKCLFPSQVLAEKGKFWNLTLSDITCSRIKKTLNQNCWSWYHFSREKILYPLILVVIYLYYRKYAVPGFLATLYSSTFGGFAR